MRPAKFRVTALEIILSSLIVKGRIGGGIVIKVSLGALANVAFVMVISTLAILAVMDYSRDIGRPRCTLAMIGIPTESGASFLCLHQLDELFEE